MNSRRLSILLPILFGMSLFISLWVQHNINNQLPSDIDIYLRAGQKALQGENAYQPFEIGTSFIYPPTALLIFAPLSLLNTSKEIWATVNITSLLLVLSIMLRITPGNMRNTEIIWLTAGFLFYAPFLEQLMIGQINTLVLLGIVLYILGISDPSYKRIGDWGLAIAISVKITPLILLAFPFINKDWHRCIRVVSYLCVLALFSTLIFGLMPWSNFLEIFPKLFRGYPTTINQAIMPSIIWITRSFIAGVDLSWFGSLFSMFILILWVSILIFRAKRHDPVAILCFGVAGMTIGSSLIWYHHLVFLLVPIIFLILSADLQTRAGKYILITTLVGTMLIQINRIIEGQFAFPPLASITGYLLIYFASFLSIYSPSSISATHAKQQANSRSASPHVSG